MRTDPLPDWLDADRADFIQSGVSMALGARDAALRPSLSRALGCRVMPGGEIRIYLDAMLSRDVLRDVAGNGEIAAVFSDIVSHRTLQVKGSGARIQSLDAGDHAMVEAYVRRFCDALVALGHSPAVPRVLLASEPSMRMAVAFHARDAFEQTPGPQAGQRLDAAR